MALEGINYVSLKFVVKIKIYILLLERRSHDREKGEVVKSKRTAYIINLPFRVLRLH